MLVSCCFALGMSSPRGVNRGEEFDSLFRRSTLYQPRFVRSEAVYELLDFNFVAGPVGSKPVTIPLLLAMIMITGGLIQFPGGATATACVTRIVM
jgi:hypothetical protein